TGPLMQTEPHLLPAPLGGDRAADLGDLLERDERIGGAEVVQARYLHLPGPVQQRRQRRAVVADQHRRGTLLRGGRGGRGGRGEREPASVAEAHQAHPLGVHRTVRPQRTQRGDGVGLGPLPGQPCRQLHALREPRVDVLPVLDPHHGRVQAGEQLRGEHRIPERGEVRAALPHVVGQAEDLLQHHQPGKRLSEVLGQPQQARQVTGIGRDRQRRRTHAATISRGAAAGQENSIRAYTANSSRCTPPCIAVTRGAAAELAATARVTPSRSRFVGDSASSTGVPVSRPITSTVGIVRARVETSAPWHRFATRCISPPSAARTAVSDSGVNTIIAISTPPSATGAPRRASASSTRSAMWCESSTIGSTVAISSPLRVSSSPRCAKRVSRSGTRSPSVACRCPGSWKSAACAPVWRHRNTAYSSTVSTPITSAWTGEYPPPVPSAAGRANARAASATSITT